MVLGGALGVPGAAIRQRVLVAHEQIFERFKLMRIFYSDVGNALDGLLVVEAHGSIGNRCSFPLAEVPDAQVRI